MIDVSTSTAILVIAGLTFATFVTRAGLLLLHERVRLSPHVEAALRFAPACALTALILPEILSPDGVVDLSLGNPRWLATLAAGAFLLWKQHVVGGLAVGMAVYVLIHAWAP